MKTEKSKRDLPKHYPIKGGGIIQIYEYNEIKNEVQEIENEEGGKTTIIVRKGYNAFIIEYLDKYYALIEIGEIEGEKQYKKWIEIEENYNDLLTKIKSGEVKQF